MGFVRCVCVWGGGVRRVEGERERTVLGAAFALAPSDAGGAVVGGSARTVFGGLELGEQSAKFSVNYGITPKRVFMMVWARVGTYSAGGSRARSN